MKESILVPIAGIGLIGIARQWLAWRVHLPAILPLLICGIIIGPVLMGITLANTQQLHIFTTDNSNTPESGWAAISLLPQKDKPVKAEESK